MDILDSCTGKSILSSFIQTMQIAKKQHNLTLKALIHQSIIDVTSKMRFDRKLKR